MSFGEFLGGVGQPERSQSEEHSSIVRRTWVTVYVSTLDPVAS